MEDIKVSFINYLLVIDRKSNIVLEKSCRHHLNQMTEVNIISNGTK